MTDSARNSRLGRLTIDDLRVQCLLLFAIVAVFYLVNASPQPGWVDSAMVVLNVHNLRIDSWVNVHMLHNFLGKLWMVAIPFGDPAWRLVTFSAVVSAGAIVNLFRLMEELGVSRRSNWIACLGTALAHSIWWHAVTIEVYCLNSFFTPLICLHIVRWDKTGDLRHYQTAALFYGLSATNHVLMSLFFFGFVGTLFVSRRRREILNLAAVAKIMGWFLLGWQVYLFVLLHDVFTLANARAYVDASGAFVIPNGQAAREVLHLASGGKFKEVMFAESQTLAVRGLWWANGLFSLVIDFPNLLLVTGPVGIVALWRRLEIRAATWFILLGFAANFVWVLNYAVWDQWAFGSPSWMIWGAFAGLGLDVIVQRLAGADTTKRQFVAGVVAGSLLVNPVLYVVAEQRARVPGTFWAWYFRMFDDYMTTYRASDYMASPFKRGWTGPRRYVQRLHEIMPQGSVFYDDESRSWYLLDLYYKQVIGERRDITSHNVSLMGDQHQAVRMYGEQLIADVERGVPVFMSTLHVPPGKLLLAYLVLREKNLPIEQLRSQFDRPTDDLLEDLPELEIEAIEVLPDEPFAVYAIRPSKAFALKRPVRREEHQLAFVDDTGQGAAVFADGAASGGQLVAFGNVDEGRRVKIAFDVPHDGLYDVEVQLRHAPDGATVRASVDDVEPAEVSLRTPAAKYDVVRLASGRTLAKGTHELVLDVAAAGSVGVDFIELEPTSGVADPSGP